MSFELFSNVDIFVFQEYRESLDLLHKLILATDLANHFKLDKELDKMIESKRSIVKNIKEGR